MWYEVPRDERDSSQVWLQCQTPVFPSEWVSFDTVYPSNTQFEVTIPFAMLISETGLGSSYDSSRTIHFRAFDGTFVSELEVSKSYIVNHVGTPVLKSEKSPDRDRLIGDPITFQITVVDLDSPTVNLRLLPPYEG
jgi:hypothetical protein